MNALPNPSALASPFWQGLKEGELRIQCCSDCEKMRFYPTEACPFCASTRFWWRVVSGKGRLYSWTVVHRSVDPEWQARAPYVAAVVEIDEQEGLLIPGLFEGPAGGELRAALPVEIGFEQVDKGRVIHRWKPAKVEPA